MRKVNNYNEVQSDFKLVAVDLVSDPSAKDAYVMGLQEGRQWVWDNNLISEEQVAKQYKKLMKAKMRKLEETATEIFNDFMRSL